jgi:tryptophan halogenase
LFGRYLRRFAEARGVERTEGKVRSVSLAPENGFIEQVTLESGETIGADLFIDCSGFRALLIGEALNTPFEDWSASLPCDRAIVAQTSSAGPPAPYTLVAGREAGWQWRIPLQHRVGNGHVYSSAFMSDDEARDILLASVEGSLLTDPVSISFKPGRRSRAWVRNCIALGLASGFLEPLEATSIHMIQRGLAMLLKFFPDRNFEQADIDRYNKMLDHEFARVRDFLLLHYTQTERAGAFWRHCRSMALPESLRERISLFRSHGRILREDAELFPIQSWLSVMIGQNLMPRSYDPLTDSLDLGRITTKLNEVAAATRQCVDAMPRHEDYIRMHCA